MDSAAGWLAGPSLEPAGHLGSDFCFNFNLCFPCSFFFFYFLLEALRWRAAMKLRRR
jgi:hypothetical protein